MAQRPDHDCIQRHVREHLLEFKVLNRHPESERCEVVGSPSQDRIDHPRLNVREGPAVTCENQPVLVPTGKVRDHFSRGHRVDLGTEPAWRSKPYREEKPYNHDIHQNAILYPYCHRSKPEINEWLTTTLRESNGGHNYGGEDGCLD
jgi:hypothetical protein